MGEAIATSSAEEVAERVTAFGGLAVVVRTPQSWAQHEQGSAVAGLPLLELRKASNAASRPLEPAPRGPLLPAAGLRILDFSRVIAGPVATRTLALLGADVLRIDRPDLPELTAQHLDTGMGKTLRVAGPAKPADLEVLENRLSTADVVVTGYRPGALDRFGLDAEVLLRRRPSLVVASLSGWGLIGPWGPPPRLARSRLEVGQRRRRRRPGTPLYLARTVTSEFTHIDAPRAWGVRGIDGPIRATVDVTVEPVSETSSRLRWRFIQTREGKRTCHADRRIQGGQWPTCSRS